MNTAETDALWPLAIYGAAVFLVVAGMMVFSHLLGERRRDPQTTDPYESGILATGGAHVRFGIKFYLIAMFFVIFDLEAAFIFAWAVSLRETGWTGFFAMLIFIAIAASALIYLWRIKALEWGPALTSSSKFKVQSSNGPS